MTRLLWGLALGAAVTACTDPAAATDSGDPRLAAHRPTTAVVSPDSLVLNMGEGGALNVTVYNQFGDAVARSVTWRVRDTTVIKPITSTGQAVTAVAKQILGSTWIVAEIRSGSTTIRDSAKATVRVTATVTQLTLSPASASLATGGTKQFTTTVAWSDGLSHPYTVAWSATGGTITGGGLYTAGATVGAYRVIASFGGRADTSDVTITAAPPPPTSGELAAQADSFVNMIGVNVHLFYGNVYSSGYASIVKPRLLESGIRHLRDHALAPSEPNTAGLVTKLQELAAQGTKALLIIDERYCTPVSGCLTTVANAGVGTVVDALEGPNEVDLRLSAGGTNWTWVPTIKQYMLDLFTQVNAGALASLPVGSPSFLMAATVSRMGDITDRIDWANIHPYPDWPNYPTSYDTWTQQKIQMGGMYGSKPYWGTETGYHTGGVGSDRPVTEAQQGAYIPRLYFEDFNRGASKLYDYELIDQGIPDANRENSFGLLRNDGTPKPAFTAIKNLITVLKDPGASFVPGGLAYTINGDLTNLHHTLLQKRDGTFYLALWLEVPSGANPVSRPISVSFPVTRTGRFYRPDLGAASQSSFSGASVAFSVADRVTLLATP